MPFFDGVHLKRSLNCILYHSKKMAKRTNAFQQLVTYIHSQVEEDGGQVTESALLEELNIPDPIPREVDVLVERIIDGKVTRIAIECRDRNAKDDITWIDGLIGKYLNLPVQRVVAVSNSGFTSTAVQKAKANRIELRSLKDAITTDWPAEFRKFGLACHNMHITVERFSLIFEDEHPNSLSTLDQVEITDGPIGPLSEFADAFINGDLVRTRSLEHINKQMLEIFKTRADLEKTLVAEHTIPVNGLTLVSHTTHRYTIGSVQLIIVAVPEVQEIPLTFSDYEKARVSQGTIQIEKSKRSLNIFIGQMSGANEAKAFFEYRPTRLKVR
jgi:hypothetical protein